jgi:DNA-binding NarL/FixJ family response regulator
MITSDRIRILLIDDHAVLRSGLANLLRAERDIAIVGEAASGEEGLALWRQARPNIGLVDVSMAGMDGIETTRRIRALAPEARIVMLTSSESPMDAAKALEAGAAAYLTKHVGHEEIVRVIRQVHAGASGIRKGVRSAAGDAAGGVGLTEREVEVLHFLRQGATNVEIARHIGRSERTAKAHVTALLMKLGATDRAGAVARGFDLGLLQPTRSGPKART